MSKSEQAWCWCCYWMVRRWPFGFSNRIAWRAYLWLTAYAGTEMYRRGEL